MALDLDVALEYHAVYGRTLSLLSDSRYATLRPYVIDLTDAFDEPGHVYIDHAHLSPQGNEIIARRLLQVDVIQSVFAPKRSVE